jgi:site-specific recombinase XerD
MLRHWFATDMIRRGINPEIARRQLRHKNIETTMKIYVQVCDQELEMAVPKRPILKDSPHLQKSREKLHLQIVS